MLISAVAAGETPPSYRQRHGPTSNGQSTDGKTPPPSSKPEALNVHRPLQYQGSGGLDANSRYVAQ